VNRWATTRLVAGREITERLQGRLIRVVTFVTVLLVVAGVTIPGLIQGGSSPVRIGLVGGSAQALAPTLERTASAAKTKIAVSDVASQGAARRALTAGRLDVALSVDAASAHVEVKQSLPAATRAVIEAAVYGAHLRHTLQQAGLAPARVLPALAPVPLRTTTLQPAPADEAARAVAAVAAALLMYVSLALYGGAVATGVAQEKTSRTAEVLLAIVRPSELLTGKVLGIGLTGLGQLALAAVAGLIANGVAHSTTIPASVWVLLPAFLVCFVAGFLLYAFALAAAGSLVARQEEVQLVTTPILMPLVIGYVLVFAAVASPDATWLKVLSLLPPFTAALMPARIALGHIAPWELPAAALIMLASVYAMIRLASRVYANAFMHSGARLSWGAAWRLRARAWQAPP
jgi:ABC-2 type transport system permease protein